MLVSKRLVCSSLALILTALAASVVAFADEIKTEHALWVGGDPEAVVTVIFGESTAGDPGWIFEGKRSQLGAQRSRWTGRPATCPQAYFCSYVDDGTQGRLVVDDAKALELVLQPPTDENPREGGVLVEALLNNIQGRSAFVRVHEFKIGEPTAEFSFPATSEVLRVSAEGFAPTYQVLVEHEAATSRLTIPLRRAGTVSGWVIDSSEESPWSVVAVPEGDPVGSVETAPALATATQDGGFFSIHGLAAGIHKLVLQHFEKRVHVVVGTVRVTEGEEVNVGLVETPVPIEHVVFAFTSEESVGSPKDWEIQIVSLGQSKLTMSSRFDELGQASLDDVYPGTYNYYLRLPHGNTFQSGSIEIDEGRAFHSIDLRVAKVFGVVTNAGGDPATAELRVGNGSGPLISTQTDASGYYEVLIPYPDRRLVVAQVTPTLGDNMFWESISDVDVEADGITVNLEIPSFALDVVVVDSSGLPVANSQVIAKDKGGLGVLAETNQEGGARVRHLREGEYSVRARTDEAQSNVVQVTVSKTSPSSPIRLTLRTDDTISVLLSDAFGTPLRAAVVFASFDGIPVSKRVSSGMDGWVKIPAPASASSVSLVVLSARSGAIATSCVSVDRNGDGSLTFPSGGTGTIVFAPPSDAASAELYVAQLLMTGLTTPQGGFLSLQHFDEWARITGQAFDIRSLLQGGRRLSIHGVAEGLYARSHSHHGCIAAPAEPWGAVGNGQELVIRATPQEEAGLTKKGDPV